LTRERTLVPEAITVAEPLELIGHHTADERSRAAARDVILGERPDPGVDVFDVAVQAFSLFCKSTLEVMSLKLLTFGSP